MVVLTAIMSDGMLAVMMGSKKASWMAGWKAE
jgi:hypothetical protein